MPLEELSLQDKIDVELVNTYLREARTVVPVASCLVLFLAISYYQISASINILIWAGLMFAAYGYQLYTAFKFHQDMPIYRLRSTTKYQHVLGTFVGIFWGSSLFFLVNSEHPRLTDFRLITCIATVIAFASSAMAASLRGLICFILPIIFALFIFFLQNVDYYLWWLIGLTLLALSSLFFGWKTHQYIQAQIETSIVNQSYIDELRMLNEKVERTNQNFIKRNIELQEMQHKLQMMASHDELTGLYNRRYVLERIREKLPEIRRHQLNFCLMIMDIDHFKGVNDEFGHAGGDVVLRSIAALLARELREGDIVARYGGEEFLLLLPMTELASAEYLVERLRNSIEMQTYTFAGVKTSVTASFGLTQYLHEDTAEKMIDRADKALYQAKLAGRNCVKVIAGI